MGTFTEYAAVAGSESICSDGTNLWMWVAANPFKISKITTSGTRTDYTGPSLNGDSFGACFVSGGDLWFTDYTNNRIVQCTTGGTITVHTTNWSGKGPCGIATDGTSLFVACLTTNQIAKFAPGSPTSPTFYSAGTSSGPFQIAYNSGDSMLWFTQNSTAEIAKISTTGTGLTEYATTTGSSQPYGICVGPDGNLWFAEFNTAKVGKITTSGTVTEYSITSSTPRYVCSDGTYLWFTDYGQKKLYRVATDGTTTTVTMDATRTPNEYPLFIAKGSDGRLWITTPQAGAYMYAYADSVTNTTTFTADMVIQAPGTTTFTADMKISGANEATFTADMKVYLPAPGASAPAESGSPVTVQDDSLYNSFPGFCLAPNGDLLIAYVDGAGHVGGSRTMVVERSTDSGATWTSTSFMPFASDSRLTCGGGNMTTLSDGSIVMTIMAIINPVGTTQAQLVYSLRSTDNGATWGTPVRIPTLGNYWTPAEWGNTAGAMAAPCVEIPGSPGTLQVALHAVNSGQDPTYCYVHTSRSTDYGASWSTYQTVITYDGATDGFEPWLLNVRKRDGSYELHCYSRSEVATGGYRVRRSVSTDSGATWGSPTSCITGLVNNTQPSCFQLPDGGIVIQTREPLGTDYAHSMRYSSDFGASFGSTVVIDSSGGDAYGQWNLVSPTVMGHAYALDMGPSHPAPNSSNTNADVYYQAFTVTAGPSVPATSTFTADLITAARTTSTFTADMVIVTGTAVTYMQTFTADMVVNDQTRTQTFTADMVVKESGTAIFTADMVVAGSIVAVPGASTFTADLYVDTESDRASRAATWFRRRRRKMSNQIKSAFVVLPDGTTRTSTYTSPTFEADSEAGVLVSLNVTAASGTGGLTLRINSVDAASGQSFPLNSAPTAVTSTGLTAYSLYPFGGVSGNMTQSTSGYLPRKFSITVTHGDSSSYTYSVGYCLLP